MIRTVLFDLDGTLLNTLEDLCDSVNAALKSFGFHERSKDEIEGFIGNGVKRLFERALPPETGEDVKASCLTCFKTHYSDNMSNKTRPYEGIEALLAELKDRGIKTAVISNKSDAAVKALCGRFFPGILSIASGASDLFREKPDPGLVLAVIRELGAIKEETVYVGDTEVDIQTARNAGIKSVGVSWGYRTKEILMMQPPDFFILHPHQLLSIL